MIPHDNTWNAVFGYVKTEAYDLNNVQWVNGYVSTSGTPTSSSNYMRTYAIRAGTFPNGCRLKFGAFSSYTLRVAEFNDTGESAVVKAANYIKSYPESGFSYEVEFEYDPTHCYAVTFGKFADAAARDAAKASEPFIRAIRCWVYQESEPYYDVKIGTVTSTNLISANIERSLFPNDYPEVGCFASDKLTFTTRGLNQLTAEYVGVYIRAISSANPETKSNWVKIGTDYKVQNVTHAHGSDIYKYECSIDYMTGVDIPFDEYAISGSFPHTTTETYNKLRNYCVVYQGADSDSYDSATNEIISGFPFSIPNYGSGTGALMCADALKQVGAVYCGNWVWQPYIGSDGTTWYGCLKLIRLFGESDAEVIDIGKTASRIESAIYGKAYTAVQIYDDGKESYYAGASGGRTFIVNCRFGSANMASYILDWVDGWEYKGIIAYNVPNVSPLIYLGDKVKIDGIETVVNYQSLNLGTQIVQTIGSKLPQKTDSEQKNSSKSSYTTNESLSNRTADIDVKEIIAKKIIIIDQYGNQHELSYMSKDSATMVLGF